MTKNNETNEAILKTVRRIEDGQASMDSSMEKDRQHLQDLTIRLEAVESEIRQVRKALNQNAERTRDKVAEVVEPMINATDDLSKQIEKKKTMVIREKGKNFLQRIVDEFRKEVRQDGN